MKALSSIILFTVLFGSGLGAALVAAKLFRLRLRSSTFYYLASVFASIALDAFLRLWSLADITQPLPPSYVLKRVIGQGIMGCAVWASVFHFLVRRNGQQNKEVKAAVSESD